VRGCLLLALVPAVISCGGSSKGETTPKGPRGVEAAELPFVVYGRDGATVEPAAMYDALAGARAVCIGEQHTNPHDHWVQLHLLDEISRRAKDGGVALALGFEMFQRPFQNVLDDYAAGAFDDRVLLARSEWRDRWGYDFALYRPMIRMAIERGLALVALNVRKEITKRVGRGGVEALTEEERAELPELDLEDEVHKAWFAEIMSGHPGGEVSASIYAAQVLWDETMADTAAAWVNADPKRRIVIFAGNGHCHDSAIVGRLVRRGVQPVISVHPVIDDGEGSADEALQSPKNDYVVVMTMPTE
jgi:uncharacterized iron-regulated protein